MFAIQITLDDKDHLGRNDRKDSHYNLIQSNGSADLVLMPIRVWKTQCLKHPVAKSLSNLLEHPHPQSTGTTSQEDIVDL